MSRTKLKQKLYKTQTNQYNSDQWRKKMNYFGYEIDEKIINLAKQAEIELKDVFENFDNVCMQNSAKILKGFQQHNLSLPDFNEVNGYGYYDAGRDKLEAVFAQIFGAEDALVRPQIMCGTHAIALTFFGLLKHGDTLVSLTGEPYDSLKSIVGICGDSQNSLLAHGIKYEQIELVDNDFDIPKITQRLQQSKVKMVEIQRSRGYSQRDSLSIAKIQKVCTAIKKADPECIIMVDNCYGDLVEEKEPTQVGADILVGSLMKNLGGGIAKTGGYVVGKKDLVFLVAERFSAPCTAKDVGANFNENLSYFKGLYFAPHAVCSSLKTMAFASFMMEKLGYQVSPRYDEKRTDIIQTVSLGNQQNLVNFCKGIQMGCPVDSFATPEPSSMPGYPHPEVSASGSFTAGSTIELSCDAPVCEPYICYLQGGLTYEYGKLGIMIALNRLA